MVTVILLLFVRRSPNASGLQRSLMYFFVVYLPIGLLARLSKKLPYHTDSMLIRDRKLKVKVTRLSTPELHCML